MSIAPIFFVAAYQWCRARDVPCGKSNRLFERLTDCIHIKKCKLSNGVNDVREVKNRNGITSDWIRNTQPVVIDGANWVNNIQVPVMKDELSALGEHSSVTF